MSQDNNALNDFYRRVYIDKSQNPGTYQYPDYSVTGIYPTCHILQSPTPPPGVRSKVYISQQEHMTPTPTPAGLTGLPKSNIRESRSTPGSAGAAGGNTLFDLEELTVAPVKAVKRKKKLPLHPH